MYIASALWRRLDTPGHETAILEELEDGWRVHGTAVFRHDAGPALLAYAVTCDAAWITLRGEVRGWLGVRTVDFRVERRENGVWTLNGATVPGLESYVDLDLGFTPATNLQQMRRVPLADGESADIPVAWLDMDAGTLTALPQRYERRSELEYWYESPTHGYEAMLELDASGFIRHYPELWRAE